MWSLAIIVLLTPHLAFFKEFTPARKNKLIFKSHLYDYVAKKSGPEFKKGRTEERTLDCVPDPTGNCSCIRNYQDFLESARAALLFRVNQMDSTDKKLKRMKVFKLRVENKAGKTEFFHNVSEVLLEAMGGNISNPVCTGISGQRQASGISDLYATLVDCKGLVSQNCIIDEALVGYNETLFGECDDTNLGLIEKVSECLNYQIKRSDSRTEDEKCLCWETVNAEIELFKSKYFIQQGNETKNCIQAIAHSAPLIKAIQLNCTNTVIGCKKSEDEAIGIVNACNKNKNGGRMLVSNFRTFMDQEEDYKDEDYDLYDDDDDYYTFDEDYYY